MSQPNLVTIVEVRSPNANPGPRNSSVECDLAFVGSGRGSALAFIKAKPDYGGDWTWCWVVYDVAVDDPRAIPRGKVVIGKDGQIYGTPKDAWDACRPAPPRATPR